MTRLEPMTAEEFGPYLEASIREYAADCVRSGRWTAEEAPAEARKQVDGILPQGLRTPGQFIFTIVAEPTGDHVGALWFAVEPRGGYIYDLRVHERFRRHGYAEQAMRAIERVAREHGATKIGLHVFGDNAGARRLYEKLGYAETNVLMSKPLGP